MLIFILCFLAPQFSFLCAELFGHHCDSFFKASFHFFHFFEEGFLVAARFDILFVDRLFCIFVGFQLSFQAAHLKLQLDSLFFSLILKMIELGDLLIVFFLNLLDSFP